MTRRRAAPTHARRQSGVIMLLVLVALVALLATGIALVRSSDVGLMQAGNLAFRRDLQNQAERGIKAAIAQFATGAPLASESARSSNQLNINYSATRLATDARGIPLVLLSETLYVNASMAGTDLSDTATAVTVRTVIDRLCAAATTTYNSDTCTNVDPDIGRLPQPIDSQSPVTPNGIERPVYRISVRATGPRQTQVYLQSTFAP